MFNHSYPMESFCDSCISNGRMDLIFFGFICRWFQLKGHLVVSAEGFESASFLGFLETVKKSCEMTKEPIIRAYDTRISQSQFVRVCCVITSKELKYHKKIVVILKTVRLRGWKVVSEHKTVAQVIQWRWRCFRRLLNSLDAEFELDNCSRRSFGF